ncbi:hypothetical protein CEXT_361391 [Caerostris extrusa]|uniref:Uncharacterized protein n=1 Tax=Caerostris extrusa TaxID=172846 RepID=A0AAV4NI88_CAEEX|nr:hypothetical protein CEXT_361391 [Caerostris extrusa]
MKIFLTFNSKKTLTVSNVFHSFTGKVLPVTFSLLTCIHFCLCIRLMMLIVLPRGRKEGKQAMHDSGNGRVMGISWQESFKEESSRVESERQLGGLPILCTILYCKT